VSELQRVEFALKSPKKGQLILYFVTDWRANFAFAKLCISSTITFAVGSSQTVSFIVLSSIVVFFLLENDKFQNVKRLY